jgi:hypothetical protein
VKECRGDLIASIEDVGWAGSDSMTGFCLIARLQITPHSETAATKASHCHGDSEIGTTSHTGIRNCATSACAVAHFSNIQMPASVHTSGRRDWQPFARYTFRLGEYHYHTFSLLAILVVLRSTC